jgi:peptide/nickel transport system permease protein
MVKENKDGIIFGVPAALVPGATIALLTICINLIVDWLMRSSAKQRQEQ